MRLKIVHRTRYQYSSSVSENFNEVRLQPVSDATQECHDFQLSTLPHASLRRYHDLHLNLVDHFYINDPHSELVVEARSTVTTAGTPPRADAISYPLAKMGECLRMERCYDFLNVSEYVPMDIEIWKLGRDAVEGIDDAWESAQAITKFVHTQFTYDTEATTVHTKVADVLRGRRGVCQDFAHVMIGMCRSLRIPARYVSGYLYAGPSENLRGDLASHAWVEIYIPGFGWLALDPTNNRFADEHHVKVAVGRDYADAAPIRGTFKGKASQSMSVQLQIERLDKPSPVVSSPAQT